MLAIEFTEDQMGPGLRDFLLPESCRCDDRFPVVIGLQAAICMYLFVS
jgi:hypothetical protein